MAFLFFLLSTLITWFFIKGGGFVYQNDKQLMLLSCGIAGGKWALQVAAAFFLLKQENKWLFIRRLGMVCLWGSWVLFPYALFAGVLESLPFQVVAGREGFFGSLIVSVLLMIPLYYRAVRITRLPVAWFWSWMLCLAVAVALQVTVVFGLI